mmetsp:Transcript_16183/g.35850  ORF Transcript_16183/g.35850 Transcript_16183/m.35850 type:complete len:205 (-) Transcript_16183:130-744(-)
MHHEHGNVEQREGAAPVGDVQEQDHEHSERQIDPGNLLAIPVLSLILRPTREHPIHDQRVQHSVHRPSNRLPRIPHHEPHRFPKRQHEPEPDHSQKQRVLVRLGQLADQPRHGGQADHGGDRRGAPERRLDVVVELGAVRGQVVEGVLHLLEVLEILDHHPRRSPRVAARGACHDAGAGRAEGRRGGRALRSGGAACWSAGYWL